MQSRTRSGRDLWEIVVLAAGLLVILLIGTWITAISGLDRPPVSLWLYVPLPFGLLNLGLGIRSKLKRGLGRIRALATAQIAVGVLDLLVGLAPWIVYLFFFRYLSP